MAALWAIDVDSSFLKYIISHALFHRGGSSGQVIVDDDKRATAAGEISADKSRMTKIKKADLHSMVVQT
jgi:hypothetical protein